MQYSVPYKPPFWLFVLVKILLGDCLKRRTLMNRPNNLSWWFITLQHVSILCQLCCLFLTRLQNLVNHRHPDVRSTHQVMQDFYLCNSRSLMEITRAVIIATRTRIQLPYVCCTWFCRSQITHPNTCRGSFNTQNFWVNTAWFAAERFKLVLPTLVVVTNTEGFCESWKLSSISVRSSLPISAYMWNISTVSAKNFVSHHFTWQTRPGRGQNSTAFYGGGAPGSAFSFRSCSGRSACIELSSWSGSGYSAGSLTITGRDVSLGHRKIGESTQIWSGHSSYYCPETLLQSSVSPSTSENHDSMLAAIYGPFILLKHPAKCISPPESSVLLARPQSTRDQWDVHSLSVSERVVFHWVVSITTTSLSSMALESVSSGAPHPVEILCFQSW